MSDRNPDIVEVENALITAAGVFALDPYDGQRKRDQMRSALAALGRIELALRAPGPDVPDRGTHP